MPAAAPPARDLTRLLRPRSIAVIGGGVWCRSVVTQARAFGFDGTIEVVHPTSPEVASVKAKARIADLDHVPDAVFLGINRAATIAAVQELSDMRAGGAVCFASGFAEAVAEDSTSGALQSQLVAAAGEMPIFGPNCYGFVNALDRALLWPDQHGCVSVPRGVAILTQSSNIAINLTMQQRGLPIAYMVTCGNMAQTAQAEIAQALLQDERVTAIGLHVEGFGDTHAWYDLAQAAKARGVPLVALKAGASAQAQQATISHTASLAGSDAGASGLLNYLGISRVSGVPEFLETLMLMHCTGGLRSNAVSSISCSGGEASLAADTALEFDVTLPPLQPQQRTELTIALGPLVAVANPLDYHTYIWGDVEKMVAAWLPMAADHVGIVLIIVDFPQTDATDWSCATEAAQRFCEITDVPVALVSTLPELLPLSVAQELMQAGIVPLRGLREAFCAVAACAPRRLQAGTPPLRPPDSRRGGTVSEAAAKRKLAEYGLEVPRAVHCAQDAISAAASHLKEPLALKSQGLAHKSDAGGVRLGLARVELEAAARSMPGDAFLVEEMVEGSVAELLVGAVLDPAHGFVLTLGAGGTLTEVLQDRVSLLIPAHREAVQDALLRLRCWPLIEGYRGAPSAHIDRLVDAVMAVQDFVVAEADRLFEVEVNPLICTPTGAVVADALIVRAVPSAHKGETDGPDQDA
ncbi:MAG: acetate--CoA ligase family protein [Pseudomonadota bacterium]